MLGPFVCWNLTWIEPSVVPGNFHHQRYQEWRFRIADTMHDSISSVEMAYRKHYRRRKESDGEKPGMECPWSKSFKGEFAESFTGSLSGLWRLHISIFQQILATCTQNFYLELQRGQIRVPTRKRGSKANPALEKMMKTVQSLSASLLLISWGQ